MTRLYQIVLIICISGCLIACGFHIRERLPVPPELNSIALTSENINGYLTQKLWQVFKSTNTQVETDSQYSMIRLDLYDESMDSQILSESASSATRQYTLIYNISNKLSCRGKKVYGPKTLNAFRNYMVNERQVLSTPTEQQILSRDLQNDLAYRIISQLNSPEVRRIINACQELSDENQLSKSKFSAR